MKKTIIRKAHVNQSTSMQIKPHGKTVAIHAKLTESVKNKVDQLATDMGVPQWVIINSLCQQSLELKGI